MPTESSSSSLGTSNNGGGGGSVVHISTRPLEERMMVTTSKGTNQSLASSFRKRQHLMDEAIDYSGRSGEQSHGAGELARKFIVDQYGGHNKRTTTTGLQSMTTKENGGELLVTSSASSHSSVAATLSSTSSHHFDFRKTKLDTSIVSPVKEFISRPTEAAVLIFISHFQK